MAKRINLTDVEQLDGIDAEMSFIEKSSQYGISRVKIGKGNGALCRFLPVALGPHSTWYARLSHYWVNGRPYLCARDTHPDFGGTGQPDALYDLLEKYRASGDERLQEIARKVGPTPQWLTYCLILETTTGTRTETIDPPKVYQPYEFWLYKANFTEVYNYFRRGTRRNPLSILDLDNGNNIYVTRTNRGLRFDREDPSPLVDPRDANDSERIINDLFNQINFKVPSVLDDDAIDGLCAKVEDLASKRTTRGSSRGRDYGDDDDSEDNVRRPRPSIARQASRNDDPDEDIEPPYRSTRSSTSRSYDDDSDDQVTPRRLGRSRQPDVEDSRAIVERRPGPSRGYKDVDDPADDDQDDVPPPAPRRFPLAERAPVARSSAPRPVAEEPERSPVRTLGSRKVSPPPGSTEDPSTSSVDGDEDNVADEPDDASTDAPVSDPVEDEDKTPPPPPVGGGGRVTRMSDTLLRKISNARLSSNNTPGK